MIGLISAFYRPWRHESASSLVDQAAQQPALPTCGAHQLDSATVYYLIDEPLDIQLRGTCYLDGQEICSYSSNDTSCGG